MTISTRHPVAEILCSNLHRQQVPMNPIGTFIVVYADALWSNRPVEQKDGSG